LKHLISLLTLALALAGILAPCTAAAQKAASSPEAVKHTLSPFLHALKLGDLQRMRPHMSADFYAHYRSLFEENREYGQYLRTFYRHIKFHVGNVTVGEHEAVAEVNLLWRDGRTGTLHIGLSRDPQSDWKINRLWD